MTASKPLSHICNIFSKLQVEQDSLEIQRSHDDHAVPHLQMLMLTWGVAQGNASRTFSTMTGLSCTGWEPKFNGPTEAASTQRQWETSKVDHEFSYKLGFNKSTNSRPLKFNQARGKIGLQPGSLGKVNRLRQLAISLLQALPPLEIQSSTKIHGKRSLECRNSKTSPVSVSVRNAESEEEVPEVAPEDDAVLKLYFWAAVQIPPSPTLSHRTASQASLAPSCITNTHCVCILLTRPPPDLKARPLQGGRKAFPPLCLLLSLLLAEAPLHKGF